jgi:hypothetical protein
LLAAAGKLPCEPVRLGWLGAVAKHQALDRYGKMHAVSV